MLSEGRRRGLRLSFNRSLSEPYGPVTSVPSFLPLLPYRHSEDKDCLAGRSVPHSESLDNSVNNQCINCLRRSENKDRDTRCPNCEYLVGFSGGNHSVPCLRTEQCSDVSESQREHCLNHGESRKCNANHSGQCLNQPHHPEFFRSVSQYEDREELRQANQEKDINTNNTLPPGQLFPPFLPPKVVSMPNSPCSESVTLQRSLLSRRARLMEPSELARKLTRSQGGKVNYLLLDLRSFVSYNLHHIRSSINLNCSDRFNRRRLLTRRVAVVDLAASPSGREILKKRCYKEVIIYDDSTSDIFSLPPHHPVFLVLSALLEDNREPILLKGGFESFVRCYPELCEDALMRTKTCADSSPSGLDNNQSSASSPSSMDVEPSSPPPPHSLSSFQTNDENAIDSAIITEVLPYLFLGNARDAQNTRVLEKFGITRVLNVTAHPSPAVFSNGPLILSKTLPAMDSGQQNLRQYFSEAISYIDEARQAGTGVIVHCQAGVSRSPTIVLAYLMEHTRMTMLEAYKLVKNLRPIISPNLNFMGQLVEWEATTQMQAKKSEHHSSDSKSCHQGICHQWQNVDTKKVTSAACQV